MYNTGNGLITWQTEYSEADVTVSNQQPTYTQFLTTGDHGLFDTPSLTWDGSVYITNATGTGAYLFNDIRHQVRRVTDKHFNIYINSQGLTLNDVNVNFAPQAVETMYWEGEFDVPVRFDDDGMNFELENYGIHTWNKIKLVEIRQD
jgi:hypothetical protein